MNKKYHELNTEKLTDKQAREMVEKLIKERHLRNAANKVTMASAQEPTPKGKGKVVLDYVRKDLEKRAEVGKEKYGTLLRTDNGRDALIDAYQEALDLVMYLRQLLIEEGYD